MSLDFSRLFLLPYSCLIYVSVLFSILLIKKRASWSSSLLLQVAFPTIHKGERKMEVLFLNHNSLRLFQVKLFNVFLFSPQLNRTQSGHSEHRGLFLVSAQEQNDREEEKGGTEHDN